MDLHPELVVLHWPLQWLQEQSRITNLVYVRRFQRMWSSSLFGGRTDILIICMCSVRPLRFRHFDALLTRRLCLFLCALTRVLTLNHANEWYSEDTRPMDEPSLTGGFLAFTTRLRPRQSGIDGESSTGVCYTVAPAGRAESLRV